MLIFSKKLLLLFSLLILASCAPKILTFDSINSIQKGDTPEQIQQLTKRKPTKQSLIDVDGTPYFIELYYMQVGTSQKPVIQCDRFQDRHGNIRKFCYQTYHHAALTEPFYLLYDKERKLVTWGFDKEDVSPKHAKLFSTAIIKLAKHKTR